MNPWGVLKKLVPPRDEVPPDGSRFYGDGNTIHSTGHLDVETRNGEVVAVWFRCALLPFEQHDVSSERQREMDISYMQGKIPSLYRGDSGLG